MDVFSSTGVPIEEDPALEGADEIGLALHRALQALNAARDAGDPDVVGAALIRVARIRFRLGQYEEAERLAQEALSRSPADSPVHADAWQVLGNCASSIGLFSQAEAAYRRAADLAREIGYDRARVAALHGLAAGVYLPCGQFDLALTADEEALDIASSKGRQDWCVYPLVTIALASQMTGQYQRAHAALDRLDRLVLTESVAQGYSLCIRGNLSLDDGDVETAQTLYFQARSIAEASGEPWLNVSVRLGIGRCRLLAGEAPNARAWADDALTFAGRVGYCQGWGRAMVERGRAVWRCGDLASAEADLRTAIEIFQSLNVPFDLARARFFLAALVHEQSREKAADAWRAAAQAIIAGGYAFLLEQERSLAFPLLAALLDSNDPDVVAISRILLDHLARVPPPPLHIVTLGRFEVRQRRRSIEKSALRSRRAGELLALLLLAPRHVLSFDQIAEALWPEKPPAAAQTAFHHATSALRRALEPDLPEKFPSRYLEVEEGRITLHLPPTSWVDLEAFEACCRRGEWEEALALYGGDLLPEYRYAEWALLPRERLALLYQRALLGAAGERLAAGRFAEALDACRQLLTLEPWHEQATLLGMRACVAMNDIAAARRLYLQLEKTLREELHTTPQTELRAYYHSLTPQE